MAAFFKLSLFLLLAAFVTKTCSSTTEVDTTLTVYKSKHVHKDELICYNSESTVYKAAGQSCVRCEGACVAKIVYHRGKEISKKGGCQELVGKQPAGGNTLNKCTQQFGEKPNFMRYTVAVNKTMVIGDATVRAGDKLNVFKKCCFTPRCNRIEELAEQVKEYKHVTTRELNTSDDIQVISVIILSLLIVIMVYSGYKVWKMLAEERQESPDYRQNLDLMLIMAGNKLSESIEEGKKVTGELTLKEVATVLSIMAYPSKIKEQTSSSSDVRVAILPSKVCQAAGVGHSLVMTLRERPLYLQSILFRMIEHGPYLFPFKPMELLELFDEALDVFQSQKTLIHIPACVIVGDLRGKYSDLCRWLQAVGWPPQTKFLFLGNVLDNEEPGSLETIALIAALKVAFPTDVYLLRGQTELFPFTGLSQRFPERTANAIERCIMRMCSFLPTAAIVLEKILAVPSGITPLVATKKDLEELARPATLETITDTERHLIFNQPSTAVRMYRRNKKSRGDFFGYSAIQRICADLGVNMIVRGGASIPHGFCPCWNHTLVSLWSTAYINCGAVLLVSPELEVTPVKMLRQTDDLPVSLPSTVIALPSTGSSEETTGW